MYFFNKKIKLKLSGMLSQFIKIVFGSILFGVFSLFIFNYVKIDIWQIALNRFININLSFSYGLILYLVYGYFVKNESINLLTNKLKSKRVARR
jgi:uncharacterized membrane protein YcgQ (UPF0703/DUF1980 family)